MPVKLTAPERAALKARAHALEPVVHIGHGGLTEAVLNELDRALMAHELVKVRAGAADRDAREGLTQAISDRTDAAVVQTVGKVIVLWRPRPLDERASGAGTLTPLK